MCLLGTLEYIVWSFCSRILSAILFTQCEKILSMNKCVSQSCCRLWTSAKSSPDQNWHFIMSICVFSWFASLIFEIIQMEGWKKIFIHIIDTTMNIYRTHTIKGRGHYSKIIFWTLRLSHENSIKNHLYLKIVGGRPLIESGLSWRGYGVYA